jgi:hypothetical protein
MVCDLGNDPKVRASHRLGALIVTEADGPEAGHELLGVA